VTDDESIAAAVGQVIARHGRIDILVNNAGIGGGGPVATPEGPGDMDTFRRVIGVNLIGATAVAAHVAHRMIANEPSGPDGERGVIVNTCSIASFQGRKGWAPTPRPNPRWPRWCWSGRATFRNTASG